MKPTLSRTHGPAPADAVALSGTRSLTGGLALDLARSAARDLALAVALALTALSLLASAPSHAADLYVTAVEHAGRTPDDLQRDPLDHPADMLRLAGIRPGMQVADFMAGDGYYSELLSYIVGPRGHVLLINNASFDRWSNNAWQGRIAHNRLPNVEHRTVDLNNLDLKDGSLDAVLLVKVYHDLYWVDTDPKNWPKFDTAAVLDKIAHALKPNGILLIVDHSAKPGTGSTAASSLHRIDEAFALRDWESRGFKAVAKSDLLRKPEDARDQISYKEPMLGKTDRFVLVFRKRAAG
jgi:predicted methyltransferase